MNGPSRPIRSSPEPSLVSRTRRFLLFLALLALSARAQDPPSDRPQDPPPDPAPEPASQEPAAQEPAAQEPEPEQPDPADAHPSASQPGASSWGELLARDQRLSFSLRSAVDASAALVRSDGTALYRSAAWIALGSAGSPGDRALIARQARIGSGLERRAAVLALGEGRIDDPGPLIALSRDRDPRVAECALLALLRSGLARAHEEVEAAARATDDERAPLAAALLAHEAEATTAVPPRAVRTLVLLRWEAARAFGMVDGTGFAAGRIAELAASKAFVSAVVLRAAAHIPRGAVRDHLLSALVSGTGGGRLAAAVDAIPRQLSQLVGSGLWEPRDRVEWSAILDEIERQRVEAMVPELLVRAEEMPDLRWRARALAARAQRVDLDEFAAVDLTALPDEDQIDACQAIGSSDDAAARDLLGRFGASQAARVRGAALVARLRLGDRDAAAEVERALFDGAHADHAAVLENLCRNAREAAIAIHLEEFMRRAVGEDLATVAGALTLQTRSSGRKTAQSLLALDSPPIGERRLMLVRALSRRSTPQDLEVFVDLFPQPGDEALNVELAVALAVLDAPRVRPILQTALWRGEFDESILAAFLLAEASGPRTLIEEIIRPPPGAGDADLRRVGFAFGAWGGMGALDALRRETGSASGAEMQGALLGALASRTQ